MSGKASLCDYALQCGARALEFYNDCFGVKYPLPKMDMIAVPDFPIGAMENWGLLTYREVSAARIITPITSTVPPLELIGIQATLWNEIFLFAFNEDGRELWYRIAINPRLFAGDR